MKDFTPSYIPPQDSSDSSTEHQITAHPHSLTILTHYNLQLTKSYQQDEQGNVTKTPYPRAKTFNARAVNAPDIHSLFLILQDLASAPQSAVIRACLRDGAWRRKSVRRLLHGQGATFRAVDRAWVCADSDKLTTPFDVDPTNAHDLDRAALWLLEQHGLAGVSAVVAFSSSAFVTDTATIAPRKVKAHIWFLLDKPVCRESLEPWLVGKGFDGATARPVQIHYTSNPVFTGGLSDPLAWRVKLFLGEADTYNTEGTGLYDSKEATRRFLVEEAARKEERAARKKAHEEAKQLAQERGIRASIEDTQDRSKVAKRLVERALEEIRFASEGSRHATIYGQAFWLGRLVGGDNGLCAWQVKEEVREAAVSVLFGEGRKEEAERTAREGLEEGERSPLTLEPSPLHTKKRGKRKHEEAKREGETLLARYARLSEQSRLSERNEQKRWLPSIPKQEGMDAVLASLGTGKTEQAKRLCAEYGRVLWLAHRRALTRNTSERLGDSFILYLDHEGELSCERLILCVDSIARAVDTVDIVVVDEADQVLQSLIKRPRRGQHADAVIGRIEYLSMHLQHARQIVLLSADLDGWTVEAFAKMAGIDAAKVRHVKHEYSHPSASWRFFEKGTAWKLAVRQAWVQGERLAIFCASREQVKALAEWMQKLRPTAKIIAIHAEAEDDDRDSLLRVAETWGQADAVLYTTSAGSGVSFDAHDHFDRVCVWGTNAPRSFMASEYTQGAERVRNPKSREVWAFIANGGRYPLTRDEIREKEKEREKTTLQHLQKHAPLVENNRKIERSKADTLAVFVWLHALTSREERAAHPLRWLLKTLLGRGIKIVHDQQEPEKKDAKALGSEFSDAMKTKEDKELCAILSAEDLSIEEADRLRQKEATKAEQDAIKKHDIARFYLDPRDEKNDSGIVKSMPPPQPDAGIILADKRGRTRKQIGALLDALFWREAPAYFAHLDRGDLVEDPQSVCDNKRKVRSVVDAAHHALRAELASDMLDVVCAAHPDLHLYLFGGCTHTDAPPPPTPDLAVTLKNLFTRGRERLLVMKVRGLAPDSKLNKIVGDLCQYFGIKRTSEQVRQGDTRERIYSIDFAHLDQMLALAKVERAKRERRIAIWEEQESLATQGGEAVTHNTKEEVKQPIVFVCDKSVAPSHLSTMDIKVIGAKGETTQTYKITEKAQAALATARDESDAAFLIWCLGAPV